MPVDAQAAEWQMPSLQTGVNWFARPDPVLQDLVGVANIGAGVGVTLYLPWGIASGYLEGADGFFSHAAEQMRSSTTLQETEDAASLGDSIARRSFDHLAAKLPEDERMRLNLQQGYDLTTYLHLNHVQTFLHGWNHWQVHDHLRLRIADVTGWAYGMMRGSTGGG